MDQPAPPTTPQHSILVAQTRREAEKMESLLATMRMVHASEHLEFFIRTEPRPRNGIAELVAEGWVAPLHMEVINMDVGQWVQREEYLAITN